jgi:hypothetical protein
MYMFKCTRICKMWNKNMPQHRAGVIHWNTGVIRVKSMKEPTDSIWHIPITTYKHGEGAEFSDFVAEISCSRNLY